MVWRLTHSADVGATLVRTPGVSWFFTIFFAMICSDFYQSTSHVLHKFCKLKNKSSEYSKCEFSLLNKSSHLCTEAWLTMSSLQNSTCCDSVLEFHQVKHLQISRFKFNLNELNIYCGVGTKYQKTLLYQPRPDSPWEPNQIACILFMYIKNIILFY